KTFGSPFGEVIDELFILAKKCDFFVGHNAIRFDRKFLSFGCKKIGKNLPVKKWIDTSIDVNYHQDIRTRKLSYLAAEHKFVSAETHRAVFDVMTMFQILSKYEIEEICARASSDLVNVIAKV